MAPQRAISKVFVSIYAILSVAIIAGLLSRVVARFADAQYDFAANATKRLNMNSSSNSRSEHLSSDEGLVVNSTRMVKNARLRFRTSFYMLCTVCISGAYIYGRYLQGLSIIDTIYFVCISMSTVGLGDLHPVSKIGKAYAAIWLVLTSLGFANIVSQYADLKLKEKELSVAKKMMSGSFSEQMYREMDTDTDGTLSESEFLGYVICKMGKVSPQEVSVYAADLAHRPAF